MQLTKDSISQTLTEEIDGKAAVLNKSKCNLTVCNISKEGSTTEQVHEKSSKIVVNGKVMVDTLTETRVQSLKAGELATGAQV